MERLNHYFVPSSFTHSLHRSSHHPEPSPSHALLLSSLQSEAGIPTHDTNHMSELSIEYSSALEREKELSRRYEDLFSFLRSHIKDSQVSEQQVKG